MGLFSDDVERALRAVHDAHEGQTRKGEETPYVTHPYHVALLLARLDADDVTLQAALLHDVVEDCDDWTLERVELEYGPAVCAIVADLTEEKGLSWEDRKQGALERVPEMRPETAAVKAADKLHNLRSLALRLAEAADKQVVWNHFSRGPEATFAHAEELVRILAPRVPEVLASELRAALEELRRHV